MQVLRPQHAGWVGRRMQQAGPSASLWQGSAPQARLQHASDPRHPWGAPADAALPTGLQSGSPSPAAVARAKESSMSNAAERQKQQQQQKDHQLDASSSKPYTVTEPDSPSNPTASGQLPAAPWQAGLCGAPAPRACLYTETTVTRCNCSALPPQLCVFAWRCIPPTEAQLHIRNPPGQHVKPATETSACSFHGHSANLTGLLLVAAGRCRPRSWALPAARTPGRCARCTTTQATARSQSAISMQVGATPAPWPSLPPSHATASSGPTPERAMAHGRV